MRYLFGLALAAALVVGTTRHAEAQLSISVGNPYGYSNYGGLGYNSLGFNGLGAVGYPAIGYGGYAPLGYTNGYSSTSYYGLGSGTTVYSSGYSGYTPSVYGAYAPSYYRPAYGYGGGYVGNGYGYRRGYGNGYGYGAPIFGGRLFRR